MGSKTKNSATNNSSLIKKNKELEAALAELQIAFFQNAVRSEALIRCLLDGGIVDKDKYNEQLEAIFKQSQQQMLQQSIPPVQEEIKESPETTVTKPDFTEEEN